MSSNYIKYNCLNAAGQAPVARVINSNAAIDQKIKDWNAKHAPQPKEETEGFTEGIAAEQISMEPQISPEEILEDARTRADKILNEAHAKAVMEREEAKEQAQILFETKKAEGFSAGKDEAQAELLQMKEELSQQFAEKEKELFASYEEKKSTMEGEIVEAIASVLEQQFGLFMEDQKQLLLLLTKKTLSQIENGNAFTIRIHPDNLDTFKEGLSDLEGQLGSAASIELHPDASLKEDDCIIETEYGIYHCGSKVQLNRLIEQMRALCL